MTALKHGQEAHAAFLTDLGTDPKVIDGLWDDRRPQIRGAWEASTRPLRGKLEALAAQWEADAAAMAGDLADVGVARGLRTAAKALREAIGDAP